MTLDQDKYLKWTELRAKTRIVRPAAADALLTLAVTGGAVDPDGLAATLVSVSDQTYRAIEVLVLGISPAGLTLPDRANRLRSMSGCPVHDPADLLARAEHDALWRGDYLMLAKAGTVFDRDCFALINAMHSADQSHRVDLLVADHDWLDPVEGSVHPVFLPGWDPEFARATPSYSDAFIASRKLVLGARGGSEPRTPRAWLDGIAAMSLQPEVRHLSEPVIHLRGKPEPVSPWTPETTLPWSDLPEGDWPSVAVVVSCRSSLAALKRCLNALKPQELFRSEVVAILREAEGGSAAEKRRYLTEEWKAKVLPAAPFRNDARDINAAVQATDSDVILLLEDRVAFSSPAQIEQLILQAMRPEIGVVGTTLHRPDGSVDQAGLALAKAQEDRTTVGRVMAGALPQDLSSGFPLNVARSCSAVSWACQAMRREVFERMEGVDEVSFPLVHGDVAFCMKLRDEGLRVINLPMDQVVIHPQEAEVEECLPQDFQSALSAAETTLASRWNTPHGPAGPWIDVIERSEPLLPWQVRAKQPAVRAENTHGAQGSSKGLRWAIRHPKKALFQALGIPQKSRDTGLAAPPDTNDGPRRLRAGLGVYGYFLSEIGLGEAARNLVKAADEALLPVSAHNLPLPPKRQNDYEFRTRLDQNRSRVANMLVLDLLGLEPMREAPVPGRFNILYPYWELSRVPDSCKVALSGFNEIWAPTNFIAQGMREAFDGPVHLLPQPVRLPADLPPVRSNRNGLRVFTYFDFDSFGARKNPQAAIAAFRQAFPPSVSDVELVVKARGRNDHGLRRWLLDAARRDKRISLIDRTLSRAEVDRLMADCDVFISLHRSEGFGFGAAEALCAGKAVVATDYGGTADFISEDTGYPVPYVLRPVQKDEYVEPDGQVWADASVDSAAACLQRIYDSPDEARVRAARGFALLRANHALEKVGTLMRERLAALGLIW